MSFATLRALHAIIGTAIDDIERVYREHSQTHGTPLEFPSLDEPYYTTGTHSPEEELAEALKDDPVVASASRQIVAACGQLSTTVNKPCFGLVGDILAGQFSACIRFLEAANIVEILREAGPEGLHVKDILRSIADTRSNSVPPVAEAFGSSQLSHILRLLVTSHYLREVKPDVFANNRLSSFIDSGKTVTQLREAPENKYVNTDGVAAFVALEGDETLKSIACLTDWALPEHTNLVGPDANYSGTTPAPESKLHSEPDGTSSIVTKAKFNGIPTKLFAAPFNLAFNTQLGYYPWLELPGNKTRLNRFGPAMTGTRQWETKAEILDGFSWEALPEGAVLVDVGGGIGAQSILVADAHPQLRVVVEDREHVVSTAKHVWGQSYAHLFDSGRMSYRQRDFFESWTPVTLPEFGTIESPSVFLVRLVLHNWNDVDAARILTRLREAAGPHTKLLIGDLLLPYASLDESPAARGATESLVSQNSPLLSNLGKANVHWYLADMLVMGVCGALERTVAEMTALALSTGWKVTEVRQTPGSFWAYTTAVPV